MKIYDISQEVMSCRIYPGDPKPKREQITSMSNGDLYNLTAFSMCAHNGTHIDAPLHFIENGKSVDKIPLENTVGYAYLSEFNGEMTEKDAEAIYNNALSKSRECAKRLLIKGNAVITEPAAEFFAQTDVCLIGVESQTVGKEDEPMSVHQILLNREVALLEGLCLEKAPEGVYLLSAAPLNLGGFDGSPCRALLIEI